MLQVYSFENSYPKQRAYVSCFLHQVSASTYPLAVRHLTTLGPWL